MEASLFSRCMTAILDGVTVGTLVNFDDVPIVIRQSIFANIQQVVVARIGGDLPAALRRGQFFDNFEQLHLLDSIDYWNYFELLSTITAEIDRPESSLRYELVSLRVKVRCENPYCSSTNRSFEMSDMSCGMAVVCRLIAACRNLRRLDLNLLYHDKKDLKIDRSDELRCLFRQLAKAIRTDGVVRAPLEQLTLRKSLLCDYGLDFSIFDSLKVLKLFWCSMYTGLWLQLFNRCRQTLKSLTLDKCHFVYAPPTNRVQLVALNSLNMFDTNWYEDGRLFLSTRSLGRVQDGRVCLFGDSDPDMLERIRDSLSPTVEVSYYIERDMGFGGLVSAYQLFGQRLVELCLINVKKFPDPNELDKVVDSLKWIRVLIMSSYSYFLFDCRGGDRFLRRFLSDADRCAKLRWLQICWDLKRKTLRLVFRHCYNLEFLCLVERYNYVGKVEITDEDLMAWAAKGAKPKEVYLGFDPTFTVDGVNRLLRNCGDDLKASFLDERRQFVAKNKNLIEAVCKNLRW